MPIVQRKSKLNDFLIGSYTSPRNKPHPNFAVQGALIHTHSKLGTYLSLGGGMTTLCAYHAEKQRPKFKTTTVLFKSGDKKGQVKSKTVEKVRKGGWKLRVFRFPLDRVVSFKQHSRHFDIVLK